ncbi:SPBc2 prophage-derived glycosyltransferase SunS [Desulfosporosinus acididurans]|uniref:SPBc2 prophage-derived glycosyltransferase SunS n=2 Tax=Desulfosporosinus acididurans TaxID=476652 RepID=A0A0J1IH55_9FIRM|nr:SPBc2 prophage-derived glycosyltransferase SunS [Desulfosporosinus acididurans]
MEKRPITISLCMIVRNEESNIANCLESVKGIPDEIVIVDTGSTDNTKEIVRQYTDQIYDFEWIDDFSAARNFAFAQARMDYILWLDADDILSEVDCQKFLNLKSNLTPFIDAVNMPYNLSFDEFGVVTYSFRRNRLVKRSSNFRWVGAVHEYIDVSGNILKSDICVTHTGTAEISERNLRIFEKCQAKDMVFTPRDLYYYGNELFEHQLYNRAVEVYQKFLNTGQGWVEDRLSACARLTDCFQQLGDRDKELEYNLKSFEFAAPRAEFCCRLGFYFLSAEKYEQAAFWYSLATKLEKSDIWGPVIQSCWTWLPHLQLCVCYDRLGKYELAYEHNEMARTFRPEDSQILHNKNYLEQTYGLGSAERKVSNHESAFESSKRGWSMNHLQIALKDQLPGLNWHEDFIVHLASLYRPKVYVELGLFQCALFNRVIPFAEQLIGVDMTPEAGNYMQHSPKTRFVNCSTQEFVSELEVNPLKIDMLFIDADHSKEAVLKDFKTFFPYVAPHGLILLHDTHPSDEAMMQPNWSGTACQAVEILAQDTKDYELMTIPIGPGLTICRKRQVQLSWQEE